MCCGPAPERDNKVSIAVPYEVTSLDPHAEARLSNLSVLSNVYEGLVGSDAEMRVVPALATRWESADPLTWTFRLRPAVAFHSGRPLRAADVVYSLNRVLRRDDLGMRGSLLNVASVKALDDLSVEVRTTRPTRILLNKLSALPIVPEGASDDRLGAAPDGTGPYLFAGWTKGRSLRLLRNQRYWAGPAAVREVEFQLNRGQDEAVQGLLAGTCQIAQCDSKQAGQAVAASPRHTVLRRSNLFVKYLGFDLSRDATPACSVRPNPFRNRLVRRAIHLAIDRHRLVAELSNYAVPALQPVPRFVFGFNPEIPEVADDKARARALLREAGLEGGFEVVLHARRLLGDAAMLVKEELKPVGIRVSVKLLPDAEFFAVLGRREASFWISRFACSSGDASDFLDEAVHSATEAHLGTKNYGGYANPELDHAIEASAGIDRPDARRAALQQAMAIVMEELVWVPLYNDQDVYAVDRSLSWQPRSDSFIRAADIETPRAP